MSVHQTWLISDYTVLLQHIQKDRNWMTGILLYLVQLENQNYLIVQVWSGVNCQQLVENREGEYCFATEKLWNRFKTGTLHSEARVRNTFAYDVTDNLDSGVRKCRLAAQVWRNGKST